MTGEAEKPKNLIMNDDNDSIVRTPEEVTSEIEQTIKELDRLKAEALQFLENMKAGTLVSEGHSDKISRFMSFDNVITHGYDRTGPEECTFEGYTDQESGEPGDSDEDEDDNEDDDE